MFKQITLSVLIIGIFGFINTGFANGYPLSESNFNGNSAYFDKIVVKDNIDVKLSNGNYGMTVMPYDNKCTKFYSNVDKNNSLVLYLHSCNNERVLVNVSMPNVHVIATHGVATVSSNSKNFHANNLEIYAFDSSIIHLDGRINVTKIIQKSHGKIELMWVNSPNLRVESYCNGMVYLAGVAKNLFVKLKDSSFFMGKYLRTDDATILATHNSRGDVLVKKHLDAYADSSSLIVYYKLTKSTIVTKNSGNVLQPETVR